MTKQFVSEWMQPGCLAIYRHGHPYFSVPMLHEMLVKYDGDIVTLVSCPSKFMRGSLVGKKYVDCLFPDGRLIGIAVWCLEQLS